MLTVSVGLAREVGTWLMICLVSQLSMACASSHTDSAEETARKVDTLSLKPCASNALSRLRSLRCWADFKMCAKRARAPHLSSSSLASTSLCTLRLSSGMPTKIESRHMPDATTTEIQALVGSGVFSQPYCRPPLWYTTAQESHHQVTHTVNLNMPTHGCGAPQAGEQTQ